MGTVTHQSRPQHVLKLLVMDKLPRLSRKHAIHRMTVSEFRFLLWKTENSVNYSLSPSLSFS